MQDSINALHRYVGQAENLSSTLEQSLLSLLFHLKKIEGIVLKSLKKSARWLKNNNDKFYIENIKNELGIPFALAAKRKEKVLQSLLMWFCKISFRKAASPLLFTHFLQLENKQDC